MDDLIAGDKLILIADASEWKFIHYKPINSGLHSYLNDGSVDDSDGPPNSKDKSFVHVEPWGTNKESDWDETKHQELPTNAFNKA